MNSGRRWYWGMVAGGALARLAPTFFPVETLVQHTIPDDAFIYFVIARHISQGLGATFDGINPTNGFHPLWAAALSPIFYFAPTGDAPVRVALMLGALCDTIAGALAGVLARRAVAGERGEWAGAMASAIYLFNPRAVLESINGLETGIAMLTLACCALAWQWAMTAPLANHKTLMFGCLLGLTMLARSDLALMGLAALALWRWRHSLLASIAAGITFAPWLLWSWWRVGTITQSSAVAIPSLVAYRIQSGTGDLTALWREVFLPTLNFSVRTAIIYSGVGLLLLLGVIIIGRFNRDKPVQALKTVLPLLAGALLIVAVHTLVRWYPRSWYFVPLAWVVAVMAGVAVAGWRWGRRSAVAAALLLGVLVALQTIKTINEPQYPWQIEMREGAAWLTQNTEPNAVVGSFNGGLYAYYSQRRMVNLDGLVDWRAIEARRDRRLLAYLISQGGNIVIDHHAYIWDSYSPFFGDFELELVAELPPHDGRYGAVEVWQVAEMDDH